MSDTTVVLAIDQGTTSTKAVLFDRTGRIVARHSVGIQIDRRGVTVEQDAEEIWNSVVDSVARVVSSVPGVHVVGLAISNQRETVVAWDETTGRAVTPVVSWQDQRGVERCAELSDADIQRVRDVAGLDVSPLFSAPKIAWCLEASAQHPGIRVGTIDAWLVSRLTGGGVYAIEAGNASRTMLLDIRTFEWDAQVAAAFGIDVGALPEVRPSTGPWGATRSFPGLADGTPILAVLGDSHAALFGHQVSGGADGSVGKVTYGTGSSVMIPAEDAAVRVDGIATTVAWCIPEPQWALEGNILYSGAAVDWVARILGVADGEAVSELAATVSSAHETVFVPALSGIGAPWQSADAVGTLTGLDGSTSRGELARAALDAIVHQVADVVDAMDPGRSQRQLHVGGGASASSLLMELQADMLDRELLLSRHPDISAAGAAALAFRVLGESAFGTRADAASTLIPPSGSLTEIDRNTARGRWRSALARSGVDVAGGTVSSFTFTPREEQS